MKYVKGGMDPVKWKDGLTQALADAEALMRSIDQEKVQGNPFNPSLTTKEVEKVINQMKNNALGKKKIKEKR